uniref:Uncharacterized protein n=2 Tax=Picea TaxID=3328 RepID=A0A117NGU1_PICGL|nr:hypothetical protein ABT39_MTgene5503 [Picea glauca]QHR91569.1 hypothetical protein Q903MT_gene5604 [Picea sitchensis]
MSLLDPSSGKQSQSILQEVSIFFHSFFRASKHPQGRKLIIFLITPFLSLLFTALQKAGWIIRWGPEGHICFLFLGKEPSSVQGLLIQGKK